MKLCPLDLNNSYPCHHDNIIIIIITKEQASDSGRTDLCVDSSQLGDWDDERVTV